MYNTLHTLNDYRRLQMISKLTRWFNNTSDEIKMIQLEPNKFELSYNNGVKIEYVSSDGKLHNTTGPAVIIKNRGIEKYYQFDKLHRENGPAIIHPNKMRCWYINNLLHREDGPAVVYEDGRHDEYWENGIRIK